MQSIESSQPNGDKPTVQAVHSAHDAAECRKSSDNVDVYTPSKRVKLEDSFDKNDSSSKTVDRLITPSTQNHHFPQQHPTSLSKQEIKSLLWKEAAYNATAEETAQLKRRDYISWDEYFMAVAALSAHRSKDPVSPSGACIVDARNRIIGIGYSGFPKGCSDDCLPWTTGAANPSDDTSTPAFLHTPTPYKVHAEVNAILNKCSTDVAGASLYTDHFPCNECAKVLVQSRIQQVVYRVDPHPDSDSSHASRILLQMAGVHVRQLQPASHHLDLDFTNAVDSVNACGCTAEHGHDSKPDEEAAATETAPVPAAVESEAVRYRDLLVQEAGYDPVLTGSTKRTDYLSWDDYFMAISFLTAQRSKDPNTQVGACIVDADKRIVGLGYNGFPAGCSDDDLPWARQGSSELHKKYLYVCHAEVNAILNKCSADVKGAVLYVALFPCNDCAKMIIQAGIREVVYMSDRYHDSDACRASRIMFKMAGVVLRNYIPTMNSVRIQLDDSGNTNNDGSKDKKDE
jgi:dCMP deaminase